MRAAIVLAGGSSRRFGRADKLQARIAGKRLIDHALDRAAESDARRIVLVVRRKTSPSPLGEGLGWGRSARIARRRNDKTGPTPTPPLKGRGFKTVIARDAAQGLSATLRAGLAALRPIEREAWIFLADMPGARAPRGLRLKAGEVAARPIVRGKPGHPMLVRVAAARAGLGSGDRGLGAAFPSSAVRIWPGEAGNLLDIDDRATLRRLRRSAL